MLKRRILLFVLFVAISIFKLFPCPFCNNLEKYSVVFNKLYSGICEKKCMILLQTDHFYVLSDDYPVAYGHLLIVPKEHITSFVSINIEWNSEITFILSELKKVFGTDEYVLFEHGCRLSGETVIASENSVYHAHLHFIPNLSIDELEVKEILVKNGLHLKNNFVKTSLIYPGDSKMLSFLKQNTESVVNGEKFFESYLFLKYKKDRALVLHESCMESKVPSQFFRKIFAFIANNDQTAFWDWKNPISVENVKILQDRFSFTLKKFNQNKLK